MTATPASHLVLGDCIEYADDSYMVTRVRDLGDGTLALYLTKDEEHAYPRTFTWTVDKLQFVVKVS